MKQYSKRMVIAHWLLPVMLIAAWFLGESAHDARHDKVATLAGYWIHISVGISIFILTLAQLFFRLKDGKPPLKSDKPMYQFAAKSVHYLLYALLILLPISGVMQTLTSDLGKALLAGDVAMLPKKFDGVLAHEVHEQLVTVLIVLVLLHILGALKHQFIMKDDLLSRMSWRSKD